MGEQESGPNTASGPNPGAPGLDHLVNKAMQDLDATKRANAAEGRPNPQTVLIKRVATVALVALVAAAWGFAAVYFIRTSGERFELPNEVAARDAVKAIVAAESKFIEGAYFDANGDGLPDYGKLHQLVDPSGAGAGPALIDTSLTSSEANGYVFSVVVRHSAAGHAPAFDVIAAPLVASGNARVVVADESGIVATQERSASPKVHDVVLHD